MYQEKYGIKYEVQQVRQPADLFLLEIANGSNHMIFLIAYCD